jgi:phytoene synthase
VRTYNILLSEDRRVAAALMALHRKQFMQGACRDRRRDAFATDHLRSHDFDWYAALQFAPADKRARLLALFAYLAEIARVRSLVSDPMPGEIRLQWWRDALSGTAHGAVEANPLAAALLGAIETHKIPRAPLLAVLDARTFDLYDDAMPTTTDFEGYAGEVWSGPMALSASLLSGQSAPPFLTWPAMEAWR